MKHVKSPASLRFSIASLPSFKGFDRVSGLALISVVGLILAWTLPTGSTTEEQTSVPGAFYKRTTVREHVGIGYRSSSYVDTETVTVLRRR